MLPWKRSSALYDFGLITRLFGGKMNTLLDARDAFLQHNSW